MSEQSTQEAGRERVRAWNEPPYRKGDWVRFYTGGGLTIGQVEYCTLEYGGRWSVLTDRGSVRDNCVLEHRPALSPDPAGEA